MEVRMENLITAFAKAIRSLFAPGMFGVFIKSIFITVIALALLVLISGWMGALLSNSFGIAILSTLGSMALAWFLFPGIMPIIVSFFDEEIVALIETQDYPGLAAPRTGDFWPHLAHDVRFTLTAVALNILVLPLYVILPLIPFIFYGLNGYLLGKEFFFTVAKRHIALDEARRLVKQHAMLIWMSGIGLTIAATIPIINFIAPFWGIAVMTHLFHRLAVPQTINL
jgi:CysZ protein